MQKLSTVLFYVELVLWAVVTGHLILSVLPYFQFQTVTSDYLTVHLMLNALLFALPLSIKGFRAALQTGKIVELSNAH